MGRSVSTPRNSFAAFAHPVFFDDARREAGPDVEPEELEYDYFDGDDLIECARQTAMEAWRSMQPCDRWLDREDHAIAENVWAYFGVSEYCGLVAYWIVAKDQETASRDALAARWCSLSVRKLEDTFGELRKVATFSNGEALFERRN